MGSVSEFIFTELPSLFTQIINGMAKVVETLSMKISDVVSLIPGANTGINWLDNFLDELRDSVFSLIDVFDLGDSSLLALMLGAGVGLYIGYTIIVWVLNVIF